MDVGARQRRSVAPAGRYLRDASRFLAAGPGRRQSTAKLSRAGIASRRVRVGRRLHPCRIPARDGASVHRLLGLRDHRLLCPDCSLWNARRLSLPGGLPAPERDRRDSRLGARSLPDRRVRAWPFRRQRAVRTYRSAPGFPSRMEHLHLQFRPRRSAKYWLEEFHADGIRVDAVSSMLYLDYGRKRSEWIPNIHGGNENLAAISFLKELNRQTYARHPGVMMIAEESTSWPGVSRPLYLGGLGFGFKWDMGWMHDTLDYFTKQPVYRRF